MDIRDTNPNSDFKRFKAICVPLLGASRLTPASISTTSSLLTDLVNLLKSISSEALTTNLISYVFLPLSTILQRNSSAEIPNQVLEKILLSIKYLVDSWWWTCDIKIWEQVLMLCGSILGGIEDRSSKEGSRRDDETKDAATQCLLSLLRPRTQEEAVRRSLGMSEAEGRLKQFQSNAQSSRFIPIIGQTLDSALGCTSSFNMSLQHSSLQTIYFLVDLYLPDPLIPSVLPGVVSTMSKICLGLPKGKGWTNGETVSLALRVMSVIILRAIGDDICVKDGVIRRVQNLEDLAVEGPSGKAQDSEKLPYGTERTESWLRGTSTQVHIAINTLTPLISHPTPSALHGLVDFSSLMIKSTALTLPGTQPLFLSFLLSLSLSDYESISAKARQSLKDLLTTPSDAQLSLQNTVMTNLGDNLSALPRLLSIQADEKIAHVAGLITAICRLASQPDSTNSLRAIAKGIGKLLGPTGGIEKWGWSLLSVLEIIEPPIVVTHTSSAQLSLESDPESPDWIAFPGLIFVNISSHGTRDALEGMFHALGAAGGESGLFSVEWFVNVGNSGTSSTSVAALWCACRLLEGIAGLSLYDQLAGHSSGVAGKRLEKQTRALAKNIAEMWDQHTDELEQRPSHNVEADQDFHVQHQTGLDPLHETLKIIKPSTKKGKRVKHQPIIQRALSLQLLAVSSGIAQARFTTLFIHVLYPVLHSLVSSVSFLSSTALATLNYITAATSYASPANLLLSNFDYVLDSVSRRLTQRWLDIDATKVLTVMIRLVGKDVVEKAGDVVEECFDRLDEFHGYDVIVDGLIEVLVEVLKVIEVEETEKKVDVDSEEPSERGPRKASLDDFFAFLSSRFEASSQKKDETNYGPVPQTAWSKEVPEGEEEVPEEGISAKPADDNEPPSTPVQVLTKQIISRSMYFLTHESPAIRAKILKLLTLSVPVLPESALLPSVHSAWPFILNRLGDSETYVITAAAELVEVLVKKAGSFMFRRVWDDIWPKFRAMLNNLEKGEATNALTSSRSGGHSPESAYTHSHRLYRSIIKTMDIALQDAHEREDSFWQVVLVFRRFLGKQMHQELQKSALSLYIQASKNNPDAVWLALTSTIEVTNPIMEFLYKSNWDIKVNAEIILNSLD